MYTLGINAAFHDSSACLVHDGMVLAAAEEERFTRIKHAKRPVPFSAYELPYHAIDFCLARAGITLADLDHVAYAFDPRLLHDDTNVTALTLPLEPSAQTASTASPWAPLLLCYVVNAPRQLAGGAPHHLRARFAKGNPRYAWHYVEHHLAHEASAFLPAPFRHAAILTLDGRGERASATYAVGTAAHIERLTEVALPHSLGLLYEDVTRHLGFQHSSDEYKVMALAAFGKPRYVDTFRDMVGFDAVSGQYTTHPHGLAARFGPPRSAGQPLTQEHCDIAHAVQTVLEETVLSMCRWLYWASGARDLCLAGGVALNCVMNGRLRAEGPFRQIWVQPAAGDAGTALGAALWIDACERGSRGAWTMDHALLGPDFDNGAIESLLRESRLPYRLIGNPVESAAELLAQGKIIGWFQGAMEFGPRALGARSLLAAPVDPNVPARLNEIKGREDFRPVAPAVLEEEAEKWFPGCGRSPFMLFAHRAAPGRAAQIPAALHVDGTARVQTVARTDQPLFYDLIRAYAAKSGIPVVINTSFNTRSEPIVCTPREALACYATSALDALVIGPYVLEKPARMVQHATPGIDRHTDVSKTATA